MIVPGLIPGWYNYEREALASWMMGQIWETLCFETVKQDKIILAVKIQSPKPTQKPLHVILIITAFLGTVSFNCPRS